MALGVGDLTGNVTVTTSGTASAVTSPVKFGSSAVQFNTVSGGTVTDTNGQYSFTTPSSSVDQGDFTIEGWISVSNDGGSLHHSDHFIEIGGVDVKIRTSTVSGNNRIEITFDQNSTQFNIAAQNLSTMGTNETYYHFQVYRQSGYVFGGANGTICASALSAPENFSSMDEVTMTVGDLGSSAGCCRVDSLRFSNVVRGEPTGAGGTYQVPDNSDSSEYADANTLVLITGSVPATVEGAASLSTSVSTAVSGDVFTTASVNLSSSVSTSISAAELFSSSASLSINAIIEDGYVESGYIDPTYHASLIAQSLDAATANISSTSSMSVAGDNVRGVEADLSSAVVIGTQNYVEANYIEGGYFESSIDANVIPFGATLSSSVTLSVSADEEGVANLSIGVTVGNFYMADDYVESGYFEAEGVIAEAFEVARSNLAITSNLSIDANTIASASITPASTASVAADADLTADAVVTMAANTAVTPDADIILSGEIGASITASTSIDIDAIMLANVSTDIAATTSIQANATATGEIILTSTVTMVVAATERSGNPRYTITIPRETRINIIDEQTREITIPKETRELELFI